MEELYTGSVPHSEAEHTFILFARALDGEMPVEEIILLTQMQPNISSSAPGLDSSLEVNNGVPPWAQHRSRGKYQLAIQLLRP